MPLNINEFIIIIIIKVTVNKKMKTKKWKQKNVNKKMKTKKWKPKTHGYWGLKGRVEHSLSLLFIIISIIINIVGITNIITI